jgi:hypothetical protein
MDHPTTAKEVATMLSTKLRMTQTLDPTPGAAAVTTACPVSDEENRGPVTVPTYRVGAGQGPATRPFSTFGTAWSLVGVPSMSKIDLHPHRWPLRSPS